MFNRRTHVTFLPPREHAYDAPTFDMDCQILPLSTIDFVIVNSSITPIVIGKSFPSNLFFQLMCALHIAMCIICSFAFFFFATLKHLMIIHLYCGLCSLFDSQIVTCAPSSLQKLALTLQCAPLLKFELLLAFQGGASTFKFQRFMDFLKSCSF